MGRLNTQNVMAVGIPCIQTTLSLFVDVILTCYCHSKTCEMWHISEGFIMTEEVFYICQQFRPLTMSPVIAQRTFLLLHLLI